MKALISIATFCLSISAFANIESDEIETDNSSVDIETVESEMESLNSSSTIIPDPSKTAYEKDSIYYNYAGIGLNFELFGDNNSSTLGFGYDLNGGYLINEHLFSEFQLRKVAVTDLFGNGEISDKTSLNLQLGYKIKVLYFDAFVMGESEYNNIKNDNSWINLGARFGSKVKLKIFNGLRFSATSSYMIGTTNVNDELEPIQGINIGAEAMLFERIGFYYDLNLQLATDSLNENNVQATAGKFQNSLGIRAVF